MSKKTIDQFPFMSAVGNEHGPVRIPNKDLSSTLVTKAGDLIPAKALKALANIITPVIIPPITYDAPIIITKGGVYKGNYRSYDSTVPAVQIWTNEFVELTEGILVSKGDIIKVSGGGNVKVHHTEQYGDTPNGNEQWGRALNMFRPKSITFVNIYVEHTGGILLDHMDDGVSANIDISYNKIYNTDKSRVDKTPGDHRAGILFNTVPRAKGQIAWNEFINLPGLSHIEDNINLYNSGGVKGEIFKIHNNYIKGAYPLPLTADYYTGSGITLDGDPSTNTMDKMSQFVDVFKNIIVSTCNACANIAAGHDIHFYDNDYICSGMFPDGTFSERFWGGMCIWDASNVGPDKFINNDQKGNRVAYYRKGVNLPYKNRQDWVVVANNPLSIKAGDNVSLSDAPITLAMEDSYYDIWKAKLADGNVTVGNGVNNPLPTTVDAAIPIGKTATAVIVAKNAAGEIIEFTPADVTTKIADTTIATVTGLIVKPLKVGKTTLSVTLNNITKNFTVEVQPTAGPDKTIADFTVTFSLN